MKRMITGPLHVVFIKLNPLPRQRKTMNNTKYIIIHETNDHQQSPLCDEVSSLALSSNAQKSRPFKISERITTKCVLVIRVYNSIRKSSWIVCGLSIRTILISTPFKWLLILPTLLKVPCMAKTLKTLSCYEGFGPNALRISAIGLSSLPQSSKSKFGSRFS